MRLNENEHKVLDFLAAQREYDGYFYFNFAGIISHVGLDRKIVRRACRSLARKGLTEYNRGLWSDEGFPAGSGYAATRAGREWILNYKV